MSIQPFFSSQVQASLANETGPVEAEIWTSRSTLGEKFWLPSTDALLLDPWDELQGLLFSLEESPIMGEGGDGVRAQIGVMGEI